MENRLREGEKAVAFEQKESLVQKEALLHERDAELGRQRLALEEAKLKATAEKARQEMEQQEREAVALAASSERLPPDTGIVSCLAAKEAEISVLVAAISDLEKFLAASEGIVAENSRQPWH